jgi:glucokinase
MLLAGDIGGTKTEVAIFSLEGGPRKPLARKVFPSGEYPSLEAILLEFLAGDAAGFTVDHACMAVAGPVLAGHAKITNLKWSVDVRDLQLALKLAPEQVTLINDLQAIALAVPVLGADELSSLNEGEPIGQGPIAVIAPGTGMGMAFLTWNGKRYVAHASEGGHADFAPGSEQEIALYQYLQKRFPHVSVERVCSGRGLPNIYDFLRDSGYAPETPAIASAIASAIANVEDRAPVIVDEALNCIYSKKAGGTSACPLCTATLDIFVAVFGAVAGNLALTVLSTGGVYLAGGIPPRILPVLQNGRFIQAFLRKGRLSDLLSHLPVRVILSRAALLGAAEHGLGLTGPDAAL